MLWVESSVALYPILKRSSMEERGTQRGPNIEVGDVVRRQGNNYRNVLHGCLYTVIDKRRELGQDEIRLEGLGEDWYAEEFFSLYSKRSKPVFVDNTPDRHVNVENLKAFIESRKGGTSWHSFK